MDFELVELYEQYKMHLIDLNTILEKALDEHINYPDYGAFLSLMFLDECEESYILQLILWSERKYIIDNLPIEKSDFIKFLNTLVDFSFFTAEPITYIKENDLYMCERDGMLILVNGGKLTARVKLPENFSNTILTCENCNEEMTVKESITLPDLTFFIFSKF